MDQVKDSDQTLRSVASDLGVCTVYLCLKKRTLFFYGLMIRGTLPFMIIFSLENNANPSGLHFIC